MFEGLLFNGNKSTIFLFYSNLRTTPEVSSKLYFVEYVKSQRNYGFLITKDLIFGFQTLDLKNHFSLSLTVLAAEKQFENNKQHTFNCIDYIGRMAEWSKALVSGTSNFDGVGSNPTPVALHWYKLTVLTTKKQLTIFIGWPSGLRCWFQVLVISMPWARIPLLSCYTVTN